MKALSVSKVPSLLHVSAADTVTCSALYSGRSWGFHISMDQYWLDLRCVCVCVCVCQKATTTQCGCGSFK